MRRTVEELLAHARARLHRLDPYDAWRAHQAGALLVDIRPEVNRRSEGEIPGSIVIERNVLEWRLDPSGEARIDRATGHDVTVVVVCNEGYSSSLAAVALHELGLRGATDLVGGFRAWRAAGLPVVPGPTTAENSRPGPEFAMVQALPG